MEISVVIPVYNAEPYLLDCLASVSGQARVKEVVIIDDGSHDGSKELISEESANIPGLILITHQGNVNLGRSASRNLGIASATCEWIAFLDADDWYLPSRFEHLPQNPDRKIEGFYDAISTYYEDTAYKTTFPSEWTGISKDPIYSTLIDHLICNDDESISLNALVVRRSICEEIGGFDVDLKTGEDTDFIWRLAQRGRLSSGKAGKPVAIRRVHGANSYFDTKATDQQRKIFYGLWNRRIKTFRLSAKARRIIAKKHRYYQAINNRQSPSISRRLCQAFKDLV